MDLYNGAFGQIHNNDFSGAVGIVRRRPMTKKAYVSECGNTYGVKGTHTDATCS